MLNGVIRRNEERVNKQRVNLAREQGAFGNAVTVKDARLFAADEPSARRKSDGIADGAQSNSRLIAEIVAAANGCRVAQCEDLLFWKVSVAGCIRVAAADIWQDEKRKK